MYHTIYPLFNGSFSIFLKSAHFMDNIHCFAFLVVDEAGEPVLVDTGFDPKRIPSVHTSSNQTEEHKIKAAIKKLGFAPAQIKEVILTHIHWDHTAGMLDFPQARFYIQADEFRGLFQLNPNEETYFSPSHWLPLLSKIELIQGNREIKPGLKVIQNGGHTSGHQLVEVQTKSGPVYIIGDSPFNYDLLWSKIPPENWQSFREGVGKKFYWEEGVWETINIWVKERGCSGPVQGRAIPWPEIKNWGSRLLIAHDARLLKVDCID